MASAAWPLHASEVELAQELKMAADGLNSALLQVPLKFESICQGTGCAPQMLMCSALHLNDSQIHLNGLRGYVLVAYHC